jgi:hypothetical protein
LILAALREALTFKSLRHEGQGLEFHGPDAPCRQQENDEMRTLPVFKNKPRPQPPPRMSSAPPWQSKTKQPSRSQQSNRKGQEHGRRV